MNVQIKRSESSKVSLKVNPPAEKGKNKYHQMLKSVQRSLSYNIITNIIQLLTIGEVVIMICQPLRFNVNRGQGSRLMYNLQGCLITSTYLIFLMTVMDWWHVHVVQQLMPVCQISSNLTWTSLLTFIYCFRMKSKTIKVKKGKDRVILSSTSLKIIR